MKCTDCRFFVKGHCAYYGWTDKSPCEGNGEKVRDVSGYDERSGLYISRYYAKKDATGADVIVKAEGGYKIMTVSAYRIWRGQR